MLDMHQSAVNERLFVADPENDRNVELPIARVVDGEGWVSATHIDTAVEGASSKGSAVLGTVVLTHTDSLSRKTDEDVAQSNYLRGRILNIIVPELTDGSVITPHALGYTYIEGQGFAQVIERVDSHSPRFDDGGLENTKIRQARASLWSQAEKTGIEPLVHIHPKNPLGKSNFRVHADGRLVWLDQYTDLPLSGTIGKLLLPQFDFYSEAIEVFKKDGKNPNFRNLDISSIERLVHERGLSDSEKILELLSEYGELQNTMSSAPQKSHRELVADDLEKLDVVSERGAQIIRSSEFGHRAVRAAQKGGEIVEYTGGKIQSTSQSFKDKQIAYYLYMTDPEIRTHAILENSILKGMSVAQEHGNISDKEYKEALDVVSPHDLTTYVGLQTFYLANSRAFDILTGSLIAANPSPKEVLSNFTATTLACSAIRGAVTAIVSRFRDTELKKATMSSMIPMFGSYIAIIQQMGVTYGEYTKDIKHNAYRFLVANISKIGFGGGWGSDREEKIWNKMHKLSQIFAKKSKESNI